MKRVLGLALALALFASLTTLTTSHAQGPPEAVYTALEQYYEYTINRDELVTALEAAEYDGGASGLFADLHAAGYPIPIRLLSDAHADSPGSVDHYTQSGRAFPCGGQNMPSLTSEEMFDGVTWLCNQRTGEWTLVQWETRPPVSEYGTAIDMDGKHCYYEHSNYRGTLTLVRGAGTCPALPSTP